MVYKYRDRFGTLRDERYDAYLSWASQGGQGGDEKSRRDFLKATLAVGTAIHLRQYLDLPKPLSLLTGPGQMKNSMAAIVAGIVGQELYDGNNHIDLKIKKKLYPDARVIGDTTPESIDANIKLRFTSVHFKGQKKSDGLLAGEIKKSGHDWNIKQLSEGKYNIVGPSWWNDTLDITVKDGKISGTFARGGPHLDVGIRGTYDDDGNVKFKIAYPLWGMNTNLEGKITKK